MGALIIIFLLVCLLNLILSAITAKQALKPNNNILLGVTLPSYMLQDDEVNKIKEGCRKKINLIFIFSILLLLPMIFISFLFSGYPSLEVVYFFIWLVFLYTAYYKMITNANKRLSSYKKNAIPFNKYTELSIPIDADDHWKNGVFYNNKNDESFSVPARIGVGSAINMGKTKGKVFVYGMLIFVVVILISVSALTLVLDFYTPWLQINKNNLIINDLEYSTSCAVSDIQDVSLVNDINVKYKINGGETSAYARGIFKMEDYDKVQIYIFKNSSPYIVIKSKDKYIIFNTKNKNETIKEYNKIKAEISK